MRLRKMRICAAVVLVLLCITLTASTVRSVEPEGDSQADHYVIVLDLSYREQRPRLTEVCRSGLDMVLDMLPLDGAKVGVIVYGIDQGDMFAFSEKYAKQVSGTGKEGSYVKLLAPLDAYGTAMHDTGGALTRDGILECYDLLAQSANPAGSSPHEAALLASVDMLQQADTADGKGHVILISDGLRASDHWEKMSECRTTATKLAEEHQWPIWTIRMDVTNEDGPYSGDGREADSMVSGLRNEAGFPAAFMTRVAVATGAQKLRSNGTVARQGTWVIDGEHSDDEMMKHQLHEALMQIMGENGSSHQLRRTGAWQDSITVAPLTCEEVLLISGSEIASVTVVGPEANASADSDAESEVYQHTFTATEIDGNIGAERGDQYFVIRLLRPDAGEWSIRVQGEPGDDIFISRKSLFNFDMKIALFQGGEEVSRQDDGIYQVDRNESIWIKAEFSYLGSLLPPPRISAAGETRVTAEIWGENGTSKLLEKDMDSQNAVFAQTGAFKMSDLHKKESPESKACIARVCVTDADGDKLAEKNFRMSCDYVPARLLQTADETPREIHGKIFEDIVIDMEDYIDYGSERPLSFKPNGTLPGGEEFNIKGSENNVWIGTPKQITLEGVGYVGTYSLSLDIHDKDSFIGSINLILKISDGSVEVEPDELELFDRDIFGLRQSGTLTLSGDILDVEVMAEPEGIVEYASYDPDSKTVEITGRRKGECKLTLKVTEEALGINGDRETEHLAKTLTVLVKVDSTVQLAAIVLASLIAVLAGVIAAWAFVKKASMIHGGWDLTLELPGCEKITRKDWWIRVNGCSDKLFFDTMLIQFYAAEKFAPYLDYRQEAALEKLIKDLLEQHRKAEHPLKDLDSWKKKELDELAQSLYDRHREAKPEGSEADQTQDKALVGKIRGLFEWYRKELFDKQNAEQNAETFQQKTKELCRLTQLLGRSGTGIAFSGVYFEKNLLRIAHLPEGKSPWSLTIDGRPCKARTKLLVGRKMPEVEIVKTKDNEREFVFKMCPTKGVD